MLAEASSTGAGFGELSYPGAVELVMEDGSALQREPMDAESHGQRWLGDQTRRSGDSVPYVAPPSGRVGAGRKLCRRRWSNHHQSRETQPSLSHEILLLQSVHDHPIGERRQVHVSVGDRGFGEFRVIARAVTREVLRVFPQLSGDVSRVEGPQDARDGKTFRIAARWI